MFGVICWVWWQSSAVRVDWHVTVPISIFRSNSKFDENSKHSSVKYTRPITTTVSLSWRVQNIVVIGRVYSKLEHSEFSSNFEFNRNMLNGTGAWTLNLRCSDLMKTSSNGNIFRITGHLCGEFTGDRWQRLATRSFDGFFDLRLNKQLRKQSWGWWFDMPSRSLWRHCNVMNEL